MDKLRILCLHGYHGSGDILRRQMSSLIEGLQALAEFVYLDAPSLASGDFGWWHARSPAASRDAGVGPAQKRYEGWERTVESVARAFAVHGPFDGVFGFSQGASLTSLLVGLRSPDGRLTEAKPIAFGFAVMVGGFPGADHVLAKLYSEEPSYDLPSVHVVGLGDGIVPAPLSHALASVFKNAFILEHAGGHVIAATPEIRKGFQSFLEDMLHRKAAALIFDDRRSNGEPPPACVRGT